MATKTKRPGRSTPRTPPRKRLKTTPNTGKAKDDNTPNTGDNTPPTHQLKNYWETVVKPYLDKHYTDKDIKTKPLKYFFALFCMTKKKQQEKYDFENIEELYEEVRCDYVVAFENRKMENSQEKRIKLIRESKCLQKTWTYFAAATKQGDIAFKRIQTLFDELEDKFPRNNPIGEIIFVSAKHWKKIGKEDKVFAKKKSIDYFHKLCERFDIDKMYSSDHVNKICCAIHTLFIRAEFISMTAQTPDDSRKFKQTCETYKIQLARMKIASDKRINKINDENRKEIEDLAAALITGMPLKQFMVTKWKQFVVKAEWQLKIESHYVGKELRYFIDVEIQKHISTKIREGVEKRLKEEVEKIKEHIAPYCLDNVDFHGSFLSEIVTFPTPKLLFKIFKPNVMPTIPPIMKMERPTDFEVKTKLVKDAGIFDYCFDNPIVDFSHSATQSVAQPVYA